MSSSVAAPPSRGVMPWATGLVAVIVAELLQVASLVLALFVPPGTVRDLFPEDFDASGETVASERRELLVDLLPYLVMAVLILLVAIILLVRLTRSGRPVDWGMALFVGCLVSIPVGVAILVAQWPIARAVAGVGS